MALRAAAALRAAPKVSAQGQGSVRCVPFSLPVLTATFNLLLQALRARAFAPARPARVAAARCMASSAEVTAFSIQEKVGLRSET